MDGGVVADGEGPAVRASVLLHACDIIRCQPGSGRGGCESVEGAAAGGESEWGEAGEDEEAGCE